MKTIQKLEQYYELIMGISYKNEHGGAYAYMQFLAYTRELLRLLRTVDGTERLAESVEGINWLFNEYLAVKFSPRHEAIFENKRKEFGDVFKRIRFFAEEHSKRHTQQTVHHAQAA